MFGRKKNRANESMDPTALIARGDYDAAAAIYRERARNDRDRAAAWHKRAGETLALAGRVAEGIGEYLAAAACFEKEDRMLQAIALYKAALRLDPKHPAVNAKLAEIAQSEEERKQGAEAASMTIRTRLKRYAPLFSEFSRDELTGIVPVMEVHHVAAGAVVFQQGDAGDSLFIVAQGEIALTVGGSERAGSERVEIDRVTDGGCFGEVSALTRAPRNFTAIATRPSELLELQRDYLEAVAIAHPRVWDVLEHFQKSRRIPVGV